MSIEHGALEYDNLSPNDQKMMESEGAKEFEISHEKEEQIKDQLQLIESALPKLTRDEQIGVVGGLKNLVPEDAKVITRETSNIQPKALQADREPISTKPIRHELFQELRLHVKGVREDIGQLDKDSVGAQEIFGTIEALVAQYDGEDADEEETFRELDLAA